MLLIRIELKILKKNWVIKLELCYLILLKIFEIKRRNDSKIKISRNC